MYPQQFDYGNLYGGFGGFNPYASFGGWGSYSPFPMGYGYGGMLSNLGSLFGGANPYDDLFSSFQTKLDDLFKNYQTQLNANAVAGATPPVDPAATGGTKETTAETKPYEFGEKFGTGALSGKGFSKAGVDQLIEAGIVKNKQEADAMLAEFQKNNAGKNVTQQDLINFAQSYKVPAKTYTMPGGTQNPPEGASQAMIGKINVENSAQKVPIDGIIGASLTGGQMQKRAISNPLTQGLNMPKSTVDLSQQKLSPGGLEKLNTKIKNRPQQGMKLQPFQSQIGSLFGSTGTGAVRAPRTQPNTQYGKNVFK